jgi:hypothetical protein
MEEDIKVPPGRTSTTDGKETQLEVAPIGRENLFDAVLPQSSYEGFHRYDPTAEWSEAEERKLVWKTDLYLLSWICFMVNRLSIPEIFD